METLLRLFLLCVVLGVHSGCGSEPPTADSLLEFVAGDIEAGMASEGPIEDFEHEGLKFSWKMTGPSRTMNMELVLDVPRIMPYGNEKYPYKGIVVGRFTKNGEPLSALDTHEWRVRYGQYLWGEESKGWHPIGYVVSRQP